MFNSEKSCSLNIDFLNFLTNCLLSLKGQTSMSVVKQEAFGIYTVTIELDPNSSPRISGGAPILLIVNEIKCSSHYPLSSFKYEKPLSVYKINRTT